MTNYSENIVTNQAHLGDSSTQTLTGDKYKGDGYYGRSDGFHTVQYNVYGFIGTIVMQATLAVDPTSTDWFTLSSTEYTSTSSNDVSFVYNFTGNYVWVRAYVSNWTDGTISSIYLNH